MKLRFKWKPWALWAAVFWGSAGLAASLFYNDTGRKFFLPGPTTHGHHQIELKCSVCHTPFGGVKNDACNQCHGAELTAARDSHPVSKFTDPRNADRLKSLDALHCVTCHAEHEPHVTHEMGVTQPQDYCFHCHADIAKERPTHKGLPFNSCAASGCHNFHDNTAIYEDFITKHMKESAVRPKPLVPVRVLVAKAVPLPDPLPAGPADVVHDWAASAHARAGVSCIDCHQAGKTSVMWIPKPGVESCARCHAAETAGFKAGFHGMRIAAGLSPMTPAMAQIPMKPSAAHRELSCNSCHAAHRTDTRFAAAEACMQCHDDSHTLAYKNSPHFKLWQAELAGTAPAGSGVSCATCHLPRKSRYDENTDTTIVTVEHNQNANLRPNEKMIRTVCLDCHGMPMVLDALADRALIDRNFDSLPSAHVESIDMILQRKAAKRSQKTNNTQPQ
ncbi:MAG TPA: cytochrome c3 family protein [Rariglobus sp.]|jgi:hypothetical protein|nr:cytochrome c3 family protein [Rariglobus sp.]